MEQRTSVQAIRLGDLLGIDMIESTMPGLRTTQVELDRFNRALVAQIEPHLELAKEVARPGSRVAALEEIIRAARPGD